MKDLFDEVQLSEDGLFESEVVYREDVVDVTLPVDDGELLDRIGDDIERNRKWNKVARALYVRNRKPMEEWKEAKAEREKKE